MMSRIISIWIKRARLGPMDAVAHATLIAKRGLRGNANQGGRRQITLLSLTHWKAVTAHLGNVDPIVRRANLCIDSIDLHAARGKILRLGPCRVRILGETRPCERMEQACPGLQSALEVPWGGGVFGEVLDGGDIKVGDTAAWE